MNKRTGSWVLALSFLGFAGKDRAQGPETRIQNLSLVALDSRGQPVNDLKPEEIGVSDSGKNRGIAFLRHIERRLEPGRALAPGEYSNRNGHNIPHATVILLDLMNQSFSTRGVSANQLIRSLEGVEQADYLYLYLLTIEGNLYTVRGLPGSEGAVKDDGPQWTKNIKPIMDAALRTVLRVRPVDMDVAVRTQLTYRALETLGSWMSATPGRKNVVWITDGVPLTLGPIRSDTGDFVDFTPLLRHLSVALDQAEIAIYPVPQIMIGSSDGPPDAPGVPRRGIAAGELSADTLNEFADMTGGRPNNGKDIGAAITQAMNDARTSYQPGYYSPFEAGDGKFHKLRVTCTRKGVRIQAKTGYYAWPQDSEAEAMQSIRLAVSQPGDAAEIGIRAAIGPAPDGNEPRRLKVSIDARDLAFLNDSDGFTGHLSVAIAGYAADGARLSAVQPMDLNYTAQDREKVLDQGIDYWLDLPAGNDISGVRFIVYDRISRSIGAVTVPLKTPGPQ